ncbi:hypothetical protein CDEST_00616 [Colletotrichum destructivum]|uniref:Uncharacterized protein n=1 Tax=Colletotrichum destructivum TaxID=34406 RepID=A0AAX4HXW3_9PEZI|nr:hypothetical protein CDEST_00616 [Colletotrichum destructivum]
MTTPDKHVVHRPPSPLLSSLMQVRYNTILAHTQAPKSRATTDHQHPRPVLGYRAAGAHLTTFPLFLGAASRMQAGEEGQDRKEPASAMCHGLQRVSRSLVPRKTPFHSPSRGSLKQPVSSPTKRSENVRIACCRVSRDSVTGLSCSRKNTHAPPSSVYHRECVRDTDLTRAAAAHNSFPASARAARDSPPTSPWGARHGYIPGEGEKG